MKRIWEVSWVDSRTGHAEWRMTEDIEHPCPVPIVTVGFIVRKNADAIAIAQSRGDNGKQFSHVMHIPRRCIISMRKIGRAKQ